MNGTTAAGFEDLQKRCVITENVNSYAIESWFKSAKSLYKNAQLAEQAGDLVDAYVLYSRTYDICFNCIPKHASYTQWKTLRASAESCREYRSFRAHLQLTMDELAVLQKKVKNYYKARRFSLGAKASNAASPPSQPSLSDHLMGKTPSESVNSRFSKLAITSSENISAPKAKDNPQRPLGARPMFPKSITIEPQKLLNYIAEFPSVSILFLDVRSRKEFEVSHVEVSKVVNVDPLICRENVKSEDLEDSFMIGSEQDRDLFSRRDQFDLIVLYDNSSRSYTSSLADKDNYHPDALRNLQKALWERMGWRKPLPRSPVLLVGGLAAWGRAGGPISSDRTPKDNTPQSPNLGPAGSRSSSRVGDSSTRAIDKPRHPQSTVGPPPTRLYPRSVHEYIFSDGHRQQSMTRTTSIPSHNRLGENLETETISTSLQPTSRPSQSQILGPYLESSQLPERPRRSGGAPIYTRQPSIGSQTSRFGQTSIGKTGLKNLGNSCFMNAVLQCLAACYPLARYFTSGQWRTDVSKQNPLGYKGNVATEFAKVLRELISDDNTVVAPTDLRRELGKTRPEYANGEQQDAQELLNFLLDALHEDLNANALKAHLRDLTEAEEFYRETLSDSYVSGIEWKRYTHKNSSIIVKLFQGQLQSRLQCLTCKHTSTTYNAFSSLSLPIPAQNSAITLHDCVTEFVKSESMTGDDSWFCAKCKTKRNAVKKLSISKLPDVLIVHFKRFETKGPWRDKLNTDISFPLSGLDMAQYVGAELQEPSVVKSIYDIFGIVYHRGSMEGGHYTAMVNSDTQRRGDWTLFDDSRVAPNNEIDGRASYLLFYSKRPTMM